MLRLGEKGVAFLEDVLQFDQLIEVAMQSVLVGVHFDEFFLEIIEFILSLRFGDEKAKAGRNLEVIHGDWFRKSERIIYFDFRLAIVGSLLCQVRRRGLGHWST